MKKSKLGLIAHIQSGPFGTQLHASDYVQDGIPMINAKNIGEGTLILDSIDYVSPQTCWKLNRYVLQEGDIVFGRAGSIDKHVYIDHKRAGFFQGTNCIRVRISDLEYAKYLSYYFWSPIVKKQISKKAGGSVLRYLNTDLLNDIEVPLVEETNVNISTWLDLLDQKVLLNNRIISELETMAKNVYDYWFVQFDFPDGKVKPYRASGGEMVWNEQLKREIPKEWEVGKIVDCITHINTGLNPRKNFVLGNGKNRYITIKNIENGQIDFNKCDLIDDDALTKIRNRSKIDVGDILYTSIEPIGRLYLICEYPKDWDINESVFSIRTNLDIVPIEYLYATLNSDIFRTMTKPLCTGSVQKGIRVGTLEQMPIVVPPHNLLTSFTEYIKPLYDRIGISEKENRELTYLRDWLLPMLMNGQVTVSEDRVLQGEFGQKDNKTHEVKKAARTFGTSKEADDTKDLLREYLEYKRDEKRT